MSLTNEQISRALSRDLLKGSHDRVMKTYYTEKLPRLVQPRSPEEWTRRTQRIRKRLLSEVYLRGHEPGILDTPPKVQWRETLETKMGYRIRKLLYEGYPGMWIPALLYEPVGLRARVPAILNPNGHHRGGKAMPYKQARCINLAKRGMLALNIEFPGMGELQGCAMHMHQGHMDLCGVAGVGVMYLAMKRGLDVLVAHKWADPERVAMTGLSGGGWQTAVLSALDERIRATVPVSGHSPIWHRATVRPQDHGDLEQTPSDLCTIADYDTLTAMFAPRPALLVHSVSDAIFRPEFMRPALYEPAATVYDLLGVPNRIGFYANDDPGTHNYERDIREQLYAFLKHVWNLDIPTEDIPCDDEILTEGQCNVGLPTPEPTFTSIARQLAADLPVKRVSSETRAADRERLRRVLRLSDDLSVSEARARGGRTVRETTIRHHVLHMGRWRIPVTGFVPQTPEGVVLALADAGRKGSGGTVQAALREGRRVISADLFGFGEQVMAGGARHAYFMECVAAAGDRPLGIGTAQLLSLLTWIRTHAGTGEAVRIAARGLQSSLVALCAAALNPEGIGQLEIELPDTLRRIIDWQIDYLQEPLVFCFGLLEQFDIRDLIALAAPVPITIAGRGRIT